MLHSAISDRHTWLHRVQAIPNLDSDISSMFHLSAVELRRKSIQDTRVDSRWHKKDSEPRDMTKSRRNESSYCRDALLLPGGDFVAVVSFRGAISLRLVGKQAGSFLTTEIARLVPEESFEVLRVTSKSTPDHSWLLLIEVRLQANQSQFVVLGSQIEQLNDVISPGSYSSLP